jgi:hypothetical protein
MRATVNLDLYNLTNTSTILAANASFGAWQTPTIISNPRLMKISMTLDLK